MKKNHCTQWRLKRLKMIPRRNFPEFANFRFHGKLFFPTNIFFPFFSKLYTAVLGFGTSAILI